MNTLRYLKKMTRQAYMANVSVFFMLMIICVLDAMASDIYKVGVVPQYTAKRLHSIWQPIIDELSKKTGLQFELVTTPSIPDFEAAIMDGKYDLVYLNPYQLIVANQSHGYLPLARDKSRLLQGVLVVHEDSNISGPADLDDQHIAFPSPNALGASLLIRQELKDKFNIKFHSHYVKTHDSVYLNVALKQMVAGGGVQKTFDRQSESLKNKLKVLYRTNKVVTHPIAIHPEVPALDAEKIQHALIAFGDEKDGRGLLKKIPIKRIGTASLSEYESLMEKNFVRFIGGVN